MATIQVKNLPDDIHAVFRRRAGAAGQSLQEYMVGELTRVAQSPTIDEVLERIGHRSGGRLSLKQAAADQRTDRRR